MHLDRLKFVPYRSKAYAYSSFSCGNPDLDLWLQTSAGQNERQNRSRTFLLVDCTHESREVQGYFSLVNSQLLPREASAAAGRASKYPMPAILLTRLAVSTSAQGQGMGGLLLATAMRHALASLEHSASEVFVVDAIDSTAIAFYQRFGLTLLQEDGARLFIATRKIRAALDATGDST